MNPRPKDSDEHYDKLPKKKGEVFCVGCGRPYDAMLEFCPFCGDKNPGYAKYEIAYIGLIVVALLSVLAVILVVYLSGN